MDGGRALSKKRGSKIPVRDCDQALSVQRMGSEGVRETGSEGGSGDADLWPAWALIQIQT